MKTRLVFSALLMLAASSGAVAQESGSVARSMFTTEIDNREPANTVDTIPGGTEKVYFYTDLRNFTDQTVTHRWTYKGEVMAEVPFNVRGPRWRVWSSKALQPIWTGDWNVTVVDGNGNELVSKNLTFGGETAAAAPADAEAPAAEEPAAAPAVEEPAAAPAAGEADAAEPAGDAAAQ